MPKAAPHPCNHPGCRALTFNRFCTAHENSERKAIDARRGNAGQRGYDAAWRKVRAAYLRKHPLCECDECGEGRIRVTASEVVDHRISIAERPDLRLVESNLRAMSKRCHDRRTARDQGMGAARRRPAGG